MAGLALGLLRAMGENAASAGLGKPGKHLWLRGCIAGWLLTLVALELGELVVEVYGVLANVFSMHGLLVRLTAVDRRTDITTIVSVTRHPVQFWGVVLVGTFLVPVAEELFFRGLVYRLVERHSSSTWAIIVSSLIFAAAHGGPIRFATLFVLGVFIAVARQKTGSVWQGMIMHMTLNGTMFALLYFKMISLK